MALQKEITLYNNDVVRYHRIGAYSLGAGFATVTLESFRNFDHRAIPVPPVNRQEFSFRWSGSTETLSSEAYSYIKSLPEWADSEDV